MTTRSVYRFSVGCCLLLACLVMVGYGSLRPYTDPESYIAELAITSAPVIRSLEAFRAKNGEFPDDLGELVPEYLPAIPKSGFPAQPSFLYYKNGADKLAFFQLYLFCDIIDVFESDELLYDSRAGVWKYMDN